MPNTTASVALKNYAWTANGAESKGDLQQRVDNARDSVQHKHHCPEVLPVMHRAERPAVPNEEDVGRLQQHVERHVDE